MPGHSRLLHDLRHAVRLLRRSPAFSAVAIVTIALAIGANAATFSFVHGLVLRPLPYPESDRIVRVLERLPSGATNGISTLNYLDWASQNTVFEYMAAEAGWRATLTGTGEPVLIRAARASTHYFDIFGEKPALGRTFRPDEDRPGADRVALLSHRLWESRFGADPSILGRDIVLNGEPYTVVGVLRQGGPFDRAAAELWTPLAFRPSSMTRDFRWLGASARLAPGVTLQQARVEMDAIAGRLAKAYPDSNSGRGVAVDRLADVLVGPDLETAVTILFMATTFVLLLGCLNLANLALARGLSREREVAVRTALGASRWRVARGFLIDHIVIAACGGLVGVGVGYALMKGIGSLMPPFALPPAVTISMDAAVLLFTLVAGLVTGLLFGAAPAWQATKPSLVTALKDGGHGTTPGSPARRLRGVLIVVEVAIAFVLLSASGLLMRSSVKLLEIDPGFTATNVLTAGLPIGQEQHPDPVELNAYLASIRAAVEAVPGVRQAAVTSALPLQGWGYGMTYAIAGREPVDRGNRRPAFFKIVSPSYFDTLGITLRSGRLLSERDTMGAPPVVIVNETLARREFPDEDPIGHRLLVRKLVPGTTELGEEIAWEIVGVISGEKITGLGDPIGAGMYVTNEQSPTYGVDLVLKTSVPPQSLQRALRSAVDRVNRDQALADVRTLEAIVSQSMVGNRVMSLLFAILASMALLLAAVGIYGLIACTAAERTREMGIRAALGASALSLRLLLFQAGMRLTMIGLAIGLASTLAATPVLSSMLYGIGVHDPLTLAVVAAVLSGVAALSSLLPAWRVSRLDPMDALRSR